MSETSKKIEILMRAASGIALGAALGSSLGLVAGSAIGSLILPGAGTLIGAAGGAFLSSLFARNLARKARSSDEQLSLILDSISENDEELKEDILTILEARIEFVREENIREVLIKMRISTNSANIQRPQKTEIVSHIMVTVKELEHNDVSAVRYFLKRIASLAQNYPDILAAYRELEDNLPILEDSGM